MPRQSIRHGGIAHGFPDGLRLVIVAILAALVTQPAIVNQAQAQSSVPAAPTGLTATSVSHDSVTLGWDDPGDTSITGYEVLRRDTVNQAPGTFSAVESNTGSAATTYTDSTVDAETRYVYRVKAINPEGTSEQSNYVNVETTAAPTPSVPAPPTGLTALSVTHDSVTLSWDDPGDSSITGYQVLRRSRDGDEYGDGQGPAEFVAVVDDTGSSATTYSDTSVTAHTRYVYRVKAINSEGMSERSSYLNLETAEEPTPEPTARPEPTPTPSVPAAPAGLLVSSATHDSVTLSWDDPGDSSVTGYQVLRRSRDRDEYGDGLGSASFDVIVDDTGSLASTYTDGSVEAGTRYAYAVKARNAQGLGEVSDAVDAETPEGPVSQPVKACPDGYVPPTPTDVAVRAVPIVVESTPEVYFVLYARHDVDGESVWYPVRVVLGQEETTTLSENVAALPVERYKVERYFVVDPADIDGDCTDDITEVNNLGTMNPINPVTDLILANGTTAITNREILERLSLPVPFDEWHLKFILVDLFTDRPSAYFLNHNGIRGHQEFLNFYGIRARDSVRGLIIYDPHSVAPDGSSGVYRYRVEDRHIPFSLAERIHTVLAANMPLLDDNLALWIQNYKLAQLQDDLPLYQASRLTLVFDEDVYDQTTFMALNPGQGYGLLRSLDPDDRPHSRDVVIYEALPNDLPRVAGIISTVPQTPLSHVNLRALQDNVPNAFIADALENDDISNLVGSHVYYAVTDDGYTIRAATQAEVDAHYASLRPAETQTPERDLTVTSITPLSEVGFNDWDAFGVKAANVAVLGTLDFLEGTVPDGFAVPFYFYDEFMKHNGLYGYIEDMLSDPDFQSDYDTKVDELKKLRKNIKKAETPEWIETALTAMHSTYPEGTSLRYRSSTNNEDLPGFNGAGLYDSKTQHPEETEEDGISKSLKQVYASLWNFRAFIERDFHRVDHATTAMGVLVHPNYSDERVNGVAVSTDPAYGTEGTYYVNSQLGEDLVTNPEAHSIPEEVLLHSESVQDYDVVAVSNQVSQGQLLMTDAQLGQLYRHLNTIHDRFEDLYGIESGQEFAMEVEFKITSDNVLAIKQARPWIFTSTPTTDDNAHSGSTETPLTARFEADQATHEGEPLELRIRFSEAIFIRSKEFRDNAFTVMGGVLTKAKRVDRRQDLWTLTIIPDSLGDVTIVLADGRPCTILGAICTYDGRRLSTRLEHTAEGPIPRVPEQPTGRPLSSDKVYLEWNDATRADSYEVQFSFADRWIDLPATSTDILFDGSSAVIKRLPPSDVHHFRVRAVNSHGASGWSDSRVMRIRPDWEGELTATQSTDFSPAKSGYSMYGSLGLALSPDEFVHEGTTYKVEFLVYAGESFWLGVDPELPADFSLRVGDSIYRGSESKDTPTVSGAGGYWWPSAAPGWSEDSPVRVGLAIHPDIPIGDRLKAPVTAYFRNFPSEHDGRESFSFRLHFSEDVTTTADALQDHVLSVSGGTVSGVEAVRGEGRIWAVSVTPDSLEPVTFEIEPGLDCALPGAICTEDGRRLYNHMVLTVEPVEHHPATGVPTISGTIEVGHTLTADTSGIADGDGMTGATFSYQWVSYDGHAHTDIQGATDSTYTLVPADEGKAFRVRVSFTDDAGFDESLTSALARSERPYGLDASESDGAVVVTWKLPAGWSFGSTFQILRNRPELGEADPQVHVRYFQDGGNSYTDTDVEPGVLYVYRVKGVDPFGYTGEASAPIEIRTARPAVIEEPESSSDNNPATGPPSIRGTARVGVELRARLSDLDDADGLSGATFSYEWLADGTVIPGATGPTYSPVAGDAGKTVTVRVRFIDDEGNEESLTSEPTEPVAP